MTPEERAAIIMANLSTAPCGSDRWKHQCEMVERQFTLAIAATREEDARIAEEHKGPLHDFRSRDLADEIATAIRRSR